MLSAVDLRSGLVRAAVYALALFPSLRHRLLYAVAPVLDGILRMGGFTEQRVQLLHENMFDNASRELDVLAQGLVGADPAPGHRRGRRRCPGKCHSGSSASFPNDCVAVGHHDEESNGTAGFGSLAQHVVQFTVGDVLVVSRALLPSLS